MKFFFLIFLLDEQSFQLTNTSSLEPKIILPLNLWCKNYGSEKYWKDLDWLLTVVVNWVSAEGEV